MPVSGSFYSASQSQRFTRLGGFDPGSPGVLGGPQWAINYWASPPSDPTPNNGYPGGLIMIDRGTGRDSVAVIDIPGPGGTPQLIEGPTALFLDDGYYLRPNGQYVVQGGTGVINYEPGFEDNDNYAYGGANLVTRAIEIDPNNPGEIMVMVMDFYAVNGSVRGDQNLMRGGRVDGILDSWTDLRESPGALGNRIPGRKCGRYLVQIPQDKADADLGAAGTPMMLAGAAHPALYDNPAGGGGVNLCVFPAADQNDTTLVVSYNPVGNPVYDPKSLNAAFAATVEWDYWAVQAEANDCCFIDDMVVVAYQRDSQGRWWYGHDDPNDPSTSGNHRNLAYLNGTSQEAIDNLNPALFNSYGGSLDGVVDFAAPGGKGYRVIFDQVGILLYQWSDLVDVFNGVTPPNVPQPEFIDLKADMTSTYPRLHGITFDPVNRYMYLFERPQNGWGPHIHIYQVEQNVTSNAGNMNTRLKRQSTAGVGRPFMRSHAVTNNENEPWRRAAGNTYSRGQPVMSFHARMQKGQKRRGRR